MSDLEFDLPGVTTILKTWFQNYEGPGKRTCSGFGSRGDALELVTKCEASFTTAADKK